MFEIDNNLKRLDIKQNICLPVMENHFAKAPFGYFTCVARVL